MLKPVLTHRFTRHFLDGLCGLMAIVPAYSLRRPSSMDADPREGSEVRIRGKNEAPHIDLLAGSVLRLVIRSLPPVIRIAGTDIFHCGLCPNRSGEGAPSSPGNANRVTGR
jgi:hypothetical protein